ncbi:MAG: hypothetical protein HC945_00255 [Nitrosarchaeum sp.]|nr:hypothetical protein [Nitrosarchaeum sp.]
MMRREGGVGSAPRALRALRFAAHRVDGASSGLRPGSQSALALNAGSCFASVLVVCLFIGLGPSVFAASLDLSPSEVLAGEVVRLDVVASPAAVLQISDGQDTFRFLGDPNGKHVYRTSRPGVHTVELREGGEVLVRAFRVLEDSGAVGLIRPPGEEDHRQVLHGGAQISLSSARVSLGELVRISGSE